MAGELTSEECGDPVGLHGVNGCSGDGFIDRTQISLPFEHNISSVLDLHEAPVIGHVKLFDHRTVESGIFIKAMMTTS
jgi:hypothetical protein